MDDKKTDSGFVEKISGEYYNLTAAEKRAADFILSHRTQCQHMSITELAEASNVAEATLSRFARRLKYKSYNEFRMDMAKAAPVYPADMSLLSGEVKPGDSFPEIIRKLYAADVDAITQTLELIDEAKIKQAVDLLDHDGKGRCAVFFLLRRNKGHDAHPQRCRSPWCQHCSDYTFPECTGSPAG